MALCDTRSGIPLVRQTETAGPETKHALGSTPVLVEERVAQAQGTPPKRTHPMCSAMTQGKRNVVKTVLSGQEAIEYRK